MVSNFNITIYSIIDSNIQDYILSYDCVIYVVEQIVQVSSSNIFHRPMFKSIANRLENPWN